MAAHVAFTPALISVTPTWEVLPTKACVAPVLQPDGIKVDPVPYTVLDCKCLTNP